MEVTKLANMDGTDRYVDSDKGSIAEKGSCERLTERGHLMTISYLFVKKATPRVLGVAFATFRWKIDY